MTNSLEQRVTMYCLLAIVFRLYQDKWTALWGFGGVVAIAFILLWAGLPLFLGRK